MAKENKRLFQSPRKPASIEQQIAARIQQSEQPSLEGAEKEALAQSDVKVVDPKDDDKAETKNKTADKADSKEKKETADKVESNKDETKTRTKTTTKKTTK